MTYTLVTPPGGPDYYISGYRLSQSGFTRLSKEMEPVRFDLPRFMPAGLTAKMAQIDIPYYINKKNTALYLFSKDEALVVNLLGSIEEWLKQR